MSNNDGAPDTSPPLLDKMVALPVAGTTVGTSTGNSPLRKVTSKTVNTTTTATDLFNGEFTVPGGSIGPSGTFLLTAFGDWLQNSGGTVAMPRLQVILGGTTLIDTGALTGVGASATRGKWRMSCTITNSATAVQAIDFSALFAASGAWGATGAVNFVTGEGISQPYAAGTGASFHGVSEGFNATAVDTSIARSLVLNTINGSANAAYEVKLFAALGRYL